MTRHLPSSPVLRLRARRHARGDPRRAVGRRARRRRAHRSRIPRAVCCTWARPRRRCRRWPALPLKQRSRNNALLLAALAPLRARLQAAIDRFGAAPRGRGAGREHRRPRRGRGRHAAACTWASAGRPATTTHCRRWATPRSAWRGQLGTTGPAYAISTACSSGAKAHRHRRAAAALGPGRRGGGRRRRRAVRLHDRRASRRWTPCRPSAAIRCRPTAAASTSARARRCS